MRRHRDVGAGHLFAHSLVVSLHGQVGLSLCVDQGV